MINMFPCDTLVAVVRVMVAPIRCHWTGVLVLRRFLDHHVALALMVTVTLIWGFSRVVGYPVLRRSMHKSASNENTLDAKRHGASLKKNDAHVMCHEQVPHDIIIILHSCSCA